MLKQFDYLFTDNILDKYGDTDQLKVLRIILGLITFINSKKLIGEYRKYTEKEIESVNNLMEFIYDLDLSIKHKSMEKLIYVNYSKSYQSITMKQYGQYIDITGKIEDVVEDSYIELMDKMNESLLPNINDLEESINVFDEFLNELKSQRELFLISLNNMKVINDFVMIS